VFKMLHRAVRKSVAKIAILVKMSDGAVAQDVGCHDSVQSWIGLMEACPKSDCVCVHWMKADLPKSGISWKFESGTSWSELH
jgi:hypothetical protein